MAEAKEAKSKKSKVKKSEEVELKEAEMIVETAPAETSETISESNDSAEGVDEKQSKESKTTAKAGKRSTKALKEAAEKEAKEERKAGATEEADKPKAKQLQKPARSRLERSGKKFRKAAELIEKGKAYNLQEATALIAKTSPVKFDATVELHINLYVDPKQSDQNIRDSLVLPAGSGKAVRIAVLAEADDVAVAKKAGAEIAGNEDLLAELEKSNINFDILIATPALMPKLGKYARTLGPRGLMPNPKSGTVTADIAKAVTEAKAGRVEYRVDSTGIIHLGVGKASFTPEQLVQNIQAVLASIKANKPASLKGTYLKSAYLTTTMGPSITLDLASVS